MTAAEISGLREWSFSDVFTDALGGEACSVHGVDGDVRPLPMEDWLGRITPTDEAILSHCVGATLDVGCGPGRMSVRLAQLGHVVLAVDIVRGAVDHARRQGIPALRRNVFEPLPREGRWDTVLLADGNIGIGGAPRQLLARTAELIGRGGRVVCDLAAPGTGLLHERAHLQTATKRTRAFAWAQVGPEAISPLAESAGLRVSRLDDHQGHWYAVLVR